MTRGALRYVWVELEWYGHGLDGVIVIMAYVACFSLGVKEEAMSRIR